MPHRPVVVATLGGLALACAAPALAQAPAPLVFREVTKGSTFSFIDNPPRSKNPRRPRFSPGDSFVLTVPLAKGGRSRGSLRATCTIAAASKDQNRAPALCYGVFALKEGQVHVVAALTNLDSRTTSGAVVGGTRAYAGARGTFASVSGREGTIDTITFTD